MQLDYAGVLSKLVELQDQEVNAGVQVLPGGPMVVGISGVLKGGWTPDDAEVFLTVGSASITISEDVFGAGQLTIESDSAAGTQVHLRRVF